MGLIGRFLDFLDNRYVFRRAAFVLVLVMTWRITTWAQAFATAWLASGVDGVGAAAMVAAVTAPFAALQAAVLKYYIEQRGTAE